MNSTLSQSYFDETVLENEDIFDLSPEDALEETIAQLFKQHLSAQDLKRWKQDQLSCQDLKRWRQEQQEAGVSLTHPNSKQGKADRQRQELFESLLLNDEQWTEEAVERIMGFLTSGPDENTTENISVAPLFWQYASLGNDENHQHQPTTSSTEQKGGAVLSKLVAYATESNNFALALQVAQSALKVGPKSMHRSRQEQILHGFMLPSQGWDRLFRASDNSRLDDDDSDNTDSIACKILWLELIYQVCHGNEPNKKHCNTKRILEDLVTCLQTCVSSENDDHQEEDMLSLTEATCRVVTVLCRFDDFSQESTKGQATDSTGMVVSSAHSTVTVLGSLGVIQLLQTVLEGKAQQSQRLLLATLQALRSLAIQDEIVQRMIGAGLLEVLQSTFQQYCERVVQEIGQSCSSSEEEKASTISEENLRLSIAAALIGLYRNMSANDELKTILCRSPQHSIVAPLIATLQSLTASTPDTISALTKLQEHVCATLGSMALRQPQNAQLIVEDYQGHLVILKAMQQCTNSMLVQRQGSLALRNLASRSNETLKQALLDAGSEPILRQAATLGAMDEAYAALRDLGCPAVLLQSNPDTGKLERQPMFGEKPLHFRPVYD